MKNHKKKSVLSRKEIRRRKIQSKLSKKTNKIKHENAPEEWKIVRAVWERISE
jgi:hypothetical protein